MLPMAVIINIIEKNRVAGIKILFSSSEYERSGSLNSLFQRFKYSP